MKTRFWYFSAVSTHNQSYRPLPPLNSVFWGAVTRFCCGNKELWLTGWDDSTHKKHFPLLIGHVFYYKLPCPGSLPLSTDLARHFNLPARSSVLRDGFMAIRVRLAIMMAQLFGVCQALFQEQQASCRGPAARPNKGYWRHKAAVVA